MVKKSTKRIILWLAIALTAFADAFSSTIANVIPVIGNILASISNVFYELTELALIFGLIRVERKR